MVARKPKGGWKTGEHINKLLFLRKFDLSLSVLGILHPTTKSQSKGSEIERCCILRVEKSSSVLKQERAKRCSLLSERRSYFGKKERKKKNSLGADSRKLKSETKAELLLSLPPLRKQAGLGNFLPPSTGGSCWDR